MPGQSIKQVERNFLASPTHLARNQGVDQDGIRTRLLLSGGVKVFNHRHDVSIVLEAKRADDLRAGGQVPACGEVCNILVTGEVELWRPPDNR